MRFLIPDHSGHSTVEFTPEQRAQAEEMFARLVKDEKKVAYTRDGKGKTRHVRTFDPDAEDTVFINPMQGG